MRRPADRRGQAAIELLALLAIVAALIAVVAVGLPRLAPIVAAMMAGDDPPPLAASADDAVAGRGLSVTATRAILGDRSVADAARRRAARALARPLRLAPALGARRGGVIQALPTAEPARVRFVTAADEERYRRRGTTGAERASAAGASIAWDGAEILARRLARPLGVAISAIHAIADDRNAPDPLPPGTRADDIVVCQPVRLVASPRAAGRPTGAWHVVIVRSGRIVVDALSADAHPCDR